MLVFNVYASETEILADESKIELLFQGGFYTEGPALGPDGNIYFSDVTHTDRSGMQGGHIWRYDPLTEQTTIFRSPSGMANGIIFDHEGRMVFTQGADFGGRAVVRIDMLTGKSTIIAGLYKGKSFNSPNDLTMDKAGRIYFTDPRYIGHEPVTQAYRGVYRIDLDGSVSLLITDAGQPNGIAVSPDQRTLYVAAIDFPDDALHALLAYELAPDGSVKGRRVVRNFAPDIGPDGIAVDKAGNIYVARPSKQPGIYVYSPTGEELDYIPTPELPTNIAFGRGAACNKLFITAGRSLYKVRVKECGYHPSKW